MNQIFNPKKPKDDAQFQKTTKMAEIKNQLKLLKNILQGYLTGDNPELKREIENINSINNDKLEDKLKIALVQKYENPSIKPYFQLYQCNYPTELLRLFAINNCLSRMEEYTIAPDIVKKINEQGKTRLMFETVVNVIREYNNLVLSIRNVNEKNIFYDEFTRLINENVSKVQNRFWNSLGNETYLQKFQKRIKEVATKIQQFQDNTEKIYEICSQISLNTYFNIEKNNDIYEKEQFEAEQKQIQENTSNFINKKSSDILDLLLKSYDFIAAVEDPQVHVGFKNYIEEISEKNFNESIEKSLVNSITTMHRAMLGYKNTNPIPFLKIYINMIEKAGKPTIGQYEFNPNYQDLSKLITKTLLEMNEHANNSPDLIQLFLDKHQDLQAKLDKKRNDDKNNRNIVNSINPIQANEATGKKEDKQDKREREKGGSLSPGKNKNKKEEKKQQVTKAKKEDKSVISKATAADTSKLPTKPVHTHHQEKKEGEKTKFNKAREAEKSFNNELKIKGLEKEFTNKLGSWRDCELIKSYTHILKKEESLKYINDIFNKFLIEKNAQINDLTSFLKDFYKKPNDFKNELSAVENEAKIPDTIFATYFLQFDATPIKNSLIKMCDEIISYNLSYIKKKTKEELVDKVEMEFEQHEKLFSTEIKTKEEYKILSMEKEKCVEEKPLRFKKIEAANDIVSQLMKDNSNAKSSGDDLSEKVVSLEKKKESYEKMLEDADKMISRAKKKLCDEVFKEHTEFKSNVEDMKRLFLEKIPDKIEKDIKEEIEETNHAFFKLDDFSKQCEKFKIIEIEVNNGLELFKDKGDDDGLGGATEGNKDLLEVQQQIKLLTKIWEIKRKMNNIVYGWRKTAFFDFNLEKMKADRSMIENELLTNCKDVKNKPIYNNMKDQLEHYNNLFAVLVLLSHPAMNHISHWEKVQGVLNEKFDPYSQDFTFEKIYLELKLTESRVAIEKLVEYAIEQQKVDEGIKEINENWNKTKLLFTFHDQFFKLGANETMISDLEDDLTQIANYKATKYYDDFKDRVILFYLIM